MGVCGQGCAGVLRPPADRDFVPKRQAGVQARGREGEEVQAAREHLRSLLPVLRVHDPASEKLKTFQEDSQGVQRQLQDADVADAFAARGLEGTVRRGDGAQHDREAEKGDGREPGANAFPVGIGVACAA